MPRWTASIPRALAMPDVMMVITGEELREACGALSKASTGHSEEGSGKVPKPPIYAMAIDTVRCVGEPVATVIAGSSCAARDAAGAVEGDYELLLPLVDPEQARRPGAPRIYEQIENNIGMRWSRNQGDVEGAFARAVVIKHRIRCQRLAGVPMEGRAVVAADRPIGRADRLDIDTAALQEPKRHCQGARVQPERGSGDRA